MSGILLSFSASETTSSSSDSTSDSPVSTGSSTPSISGRLSPLPESNEGKADLEDDCPLPIRALAEADRAVLDLEGPSFCPLGAGADGSEGILGHSVDLDDIMLVFGTEEGGAEEAAESLDWMLTEVIIKEKGKGLPADAYRVDEKEISSMEAIVGSSQVMVRNLKAREREESEAEGMTVGERDPASQDLSSRGERSVGGGEAEGCAFVADVRGGAEEKVEAVEVMLDEGEGRLGFSGTGEGGEAENCLAIVRSCEVGKKTESGDDKRQFEERKKCAAGKGLLVAERFQPYASATDLVELLGLGSSSDTEEDEIYAKELGDEEPLAIVADKRHPAEVEGSSGRFGECESEGLTEEVGAVRGGDAPPWNVG